MAHPPAPHRQVGHDAKTLVFVVRLPAILPTFAAARTYFFIGAKAGR